MRGLNLVEIVEDVDVSASRSRLDRPGLRRVRARIAEGTADAVMVWRLDRLVRSVVDVGVLLDEGLQIISATESLDTTSPMGRAMVEILQVFASMEAKTIGLRVSASQEHLRKVGRFPGGVVPYGYRSIPHPDGVGRALEPEPKEAAAVRRVADEVLAGSSVYAACARLNADGIKPRRAEQWGPTALQRMLRSNAVLGRVKARGEILRDDETGLPIVFWEPILSVADVERLRVITDWKPTPGRAEATRQGRQRRRASRMLSGFLTCPGCGGNLIVKQRPAPARPIYACAAAAQGRVCAGGIAVECDRVEDEVGRKFLALVGRYLVTEKVITQRDVAHLAGLEEAIRETTDAMREPGADVGALVARLARLQAERARLDAEPVEPTVELVETDETFADRWDRTEWLDRREMLLAAGVVVEVAPAKRRGLWDPARVSISVGHGD
ncbi:hypothetical protein BIV04_03095 [Frigoribacterium sp. MCBA15_019]|nr:hypothetical protein BIV04_03095 [Frigoribacterium sp. MCBA15_019]